MRADYPNITLKALRVNCGLSQDEAREKLKINKNLLVGIERGNATPSIELFNKMCDLYNVSKENKDFIILQ